MKKEPSDNLMRQPRLTKCAAPLLNLLSQGATTLGGTVTHAKLLRISIILAIVSLMVLVLPAVLAYKWIGFAKVAGIPMSSETSVSSETLPPNVKHILISQSGEYVITVRRVKVLNVEALLDDRGLVKGFNVDVEIRSPGTTTVEIVLSLTLADGSSVSVSKEVSLPRGTSTIYLELPSTIHPDDITSVHVTASPK